MLQEPQDETHGRTTCFPRRFAGPELVETVSIAFTWHGGFAESQKKKNVAALHAGAGMRGLRPLLEVSRRSLEALGTALSAFTLMTTAEGHPCTVECAFQGSKVFAKGGPYTDLYGDDSRAAKRDERLKTSGPLVGFTFEGGAYPLTPRTAFYDWIYLSALARQDVLLAWLREYAGFTDIEFNPDKSLNCQARTCALAVALDARGLLGEALSSFEHLAAHLS